MTNTNELKAAIMRKGLTIKSLAAQMGISTGTLSRKINGKREFRASEMLILAEVLGLTGEEINYIFFCL